ncbi:ABC transporter ATP-binding protein [Christiangramia sp. OXR-203]|uniref:ABC transporter ATP-binding protein n=1 Tax=Christiangramia sp. OXR-203 TaxID=3100176 RepID=UPI002AC8AAA9|nr:ABC transporter ATP-binding protein [Christiangramia sp. OXR-203]WPY99707.1 ABC transporter ATP-binding protein [Christiangramia sp. OXR-203]
MIKKIIKKYFTSFAYFYSYLGYRVFILVGLSIFVGILDGLGLTMFLPLLQMVNDSSEVDPEALGKLQFIVDFINDIGFSLNLVSILAFMAIFFLAKGLVQYASGIYSVNVREWFIKNLRLNNIKWLNSLKYKYFVMSDVGRIQNTLTGEVDRVAASYFNYFKALEFGVLVFVYMTFAFRIDSQFAILVTVGGVLTNFLYKSLYKNTKNVSRTLTGENNVFQSLVIQNVANYKYLKATGSLESYGNKLRESVNKIKSSNKQIGKLDALLFAGKEPILIFVLVTVIYIQTSFFGSDLGPILISLIFFYRALTNLMQMQTRWNKFLAVSGSLENMTAFGKELRSNKEKRGTLKLEVQIEKMELSKVNFYYNETAILKNISLNIQKHESIAFVGESGSGKTTLVNIIAGLLPIDNGNYFLNGESIEKIDKRSIQKKIGYITQDPVIFNDTVFNNISFWDEDNESNRERFWLAVKQASILGFINELTDKENTILENNGVNLSGGQRQRISIARELYKNVEILILDEATSALDSETEKAIQENIDELKGNYTILIVAHRIATIKNADRIVVMKKGEISNVNTFSNLIDESPYFKKLVELQEI